MVVIEVPITADGRFKLGSSPSDSPVDVAESLERLSRVVFSLASDILAVLVNRLTVLKTHFTLKEKIKVHASETRSSLNIEQKVRLTLNSRKKDKVFETFKRQFSTNY